MFTIDVKTKRIILDDGRGRELKFAAGTFSGSKTANYDSLFDPLNDFIAREGHILRVSLFGLYAEALDIVRTEDNQQVMENKLTDIVARLFVLVKPEKVEMYVKTISDLKPASDVKPNFESIESKFRRECTYDQPEYMDLVVLIVLIRFVMPIWGEYVVRIYQATAVVKDIYYAYMLLKGSVIVELPAYGRLLAYVTAQMNSSVDTNVTTLGGLGKDEIPEWLMASVIVKKLTVHNLNRSNENVVATMWKTIRNQLKSPAAHLTDSGNNYRARQTIGRDEDGQEQSFIETYRSRMPSFYEIETNIVYLQSGVGKIASDIVPEFDLSIAEAVVAVTNNIEQIELEDYHHILSLWVLDKTLLTIAPDIIEREVTANGMRVAQALLHYWGLHNIALLVTSNRIHDESGENEAMTEALDSVPVDILDKLDEIYPWAIPGVQSKNNLVARNANYGYVAIRKLAEELVQYKYAVRTPAFLSMKDVDVDQYGHMYPAGSILKELAILLIKLDELKQTS